MPANFLASVQPMADESGLIYFRELVATQTRGDITAGDVIGSESGKLSHDLDSYYSEMLTWAPVISIAGGQIDTTTTLQAAPIRDRLVKVSIVVVGGIDAGTYTGMDDGEGVIYGNWPNGTEHYHGTVAYTGTCEIHLHTDFVAATSVTTEVTYYQNLSQATSIPGFTYRLTSKTIRANYFILTTEYSSLSEYAVRRRFGAAMADDIVTSAVTQINASVLSSMIRKLKASAIATGTVQWDGSAPTGVPLAMHRQTFTDAIEAAAQLIDAATGRGAISFIVAGSFTRRVLATLGVEMVRKPLPGPYLCGFFQGIPVFYAPQDLVENDECLVGYRGASWFEAPIVYAPWLPVVVVKGQGSNVFNRISGLAHAAGIETLISGFTSRIKIV